jgi:hypothetical protein
MTDKERATLGRPTKYNEEMAERICVGLTNKTAQKVCEDVGIQMKTYYEWLSRYPDFLKNCLKSRKIYAVNLMDQSDEIIQEAIRNRNDRDFKDNVPAYKLACDTLSRLAGKANQELYGNKEDKEKGNTIINIVDKGKEYKIEGDNG